MTTKTTEQIITFAVQDVIEIAQELIKGGAKQRKNVRDAMGAIEFYVALPKGAGRFGSVQVVLHCLEKGALNVDLFELALQSTGFVKSCYHICDVV
jgi:hypothetical protein